jgi:hypothetical protein
LFRMDFIFCKPAFPPMRARNDGHSGEFKRAFSTKLSTGAEWLRTPAGSASRGNRDLRRVRIAR